MSTVTDTETGTVETAIDVVTPQNLVVYQPQKLESLLGTLDLIDKISERVGEDRSGDLGGGGASATGGRQGDDDDISPREKLLQNLPVQGKMHQKLSSQIQREARSVERSIRSLRRVQKRGNAYQLNLLYRQLRQLYGLLDEIMNASYEVIRRLYIRVFVDKQSILQTT